MSCRWSKKDTLGVRKYPYFICQQDARKGVSECPIRHVSATTVQEAIEQELESIMMASTTMLVAAANVTPFTPEQIVTGFRRHDFWQQLSTNDRKAIYRLFIRSVTVFESALDRAFAWLRLIDEGKASSVHELADLVEEDRHYVRYTLRLAFLSPRIIRAAMTGDLPNGFSQEKVRKVETDDWAEQERILGFPST